MAPTAPTSSRRDDALARVVLCVDDDPDYLAIVRKMVAGSGVESIGASSAEEALEIIERQRVDAIVTDLNLPERTGIELVQTLRGAGNNVPVLVLTGEGSVHAAVEALKQGAADFLQKPIDGQRLRGLVSELLANGPMMGTGSDAAAPAMSGQPLDSDLRPVSADGWFEGMLGRSPQMRTVFDAIERVARTEAPVLIVGESGSGKELVARAVHNRSGRRHAAFVPVHTGAIPKELVASELFGHERGAFTGALTAADGKFEAASRGSIFLDEVGTMVHDVQIALLRVLETMRFTRVGGRKEHVADVRVIAATNRVLITLVQENRFREDLYFRLNVFSITLPPLRDRREDILPLAEHYLARFAQRYGTPARRISMGAAERLINYPWPGNVRELRNVMERAAVFATSSELAAHALQLVAERLPDPGQVVRETQARSAAHYAAQPRYDAPPADGGLSPPLAGSTGPFGQMPTLDGLSAQPPVALPSSYNPPPLPVPMTPPPMAAVQPIPRSEPPPMVPPNAIVIPLGTTIQEAEKSLILRTLEHVGGNKQKAARVLGISRRCLYNRLEEYGVMKSNAEPAPEEDVAATDAAEAEA
ncbi:MAG: sigma-54-dependent Fis family transcriptional regulator [Deltaproteobacteria bacterium]|nr:sigma-54-dependent Fis family transcriptional regulator [Deltaproteobacteria bacterium]